MLCKELTKLKEVIDKELPKGIEVKYVSPKDMLIACRGTIERVDNGKG